MKIIVSLFSKFYIVKMYNEHDQIQLLWKVVGSGGVDGRNDGGGDGGDG